MWASSSEAKGHIIGVRKKSKWPGKILHLFFFPTVLHQLNNFPAYFDFFFAPNIACVANVSAGFIAFVAVWMRRNWLPSLPSAKKWKKNKTPTESLAEQVTPQHIYLSLGLPMWLEKTSRLILMPLWFKWQHTSLTPHFCKFICEVKLVSPTLFFNAVLESSQYQDLLFHHKNHYWNIIMLHSRR